MPILFFSALILLPVSLILLFKKSVRESKKRKNRIVLTSVICVLYIGAVLTFSFFKKRKFDSTVPQLLAGRYQYFDSTVNGAIDTAFFYPEVMLSPDKVSRKGVLLAVIFLMENFPSLPVLVV